MKILEMPLTTAAIKPMKPIRKLGTVAVDRCESTPVVWHGRLLRLDIVDRNLNPKCYAHFFDAMTGEPVGERFADGCVFPSAYTENGRMYVIAPPKDYAHELIMFESDDLIHWEKSVIATLPENWTLFNTSLCASPDGYTIALEMGGENSVVGNGFTIVFLRAPKDDIHSFTLLDPHEYVFTPERYSACPVIRWSDGYYYMIYLEMLPLWKFMPYIVRSRDLLNFEPGLRNPVLCPSDDDKKIFDEKLFTPAELDYIRDTPDVNNSDVDLCEFNGKTFIVYSWGIQLGKEFLAQAEYDGPMDEFFKAFYAD